MRRAYDGHFPAVLSSILRYCYCRAVATAWNVRDRVRVTRFVLSFLNGAVVPAIVISRAIFFEHPNIHVGYRWCRVLAGVG